ncbi:putative cysteine ligase BshC [Pullulanibacillus camelliae]|uniref:Putative cysteine ligase BshC n=1 Tax=Pullulanibacillus camelliae TaxID=1707096 RepID=A0A8J2VVN5_9BACL|nr:bacillithiol biosynthesis cysteine-adding enzyme BshC [Pullulanibacillus camelliae]GGE41272.1 putative cysteine ligase BshC [Pullulanibacillus camelliae]
MEIEKIHLTEPSNLTEDYISGKASIQSFFDYDISDPECYKKRLNYLNEMSYDREGLTDYLHHFNQPFQPHDKVLNNIERLKDPRAVVVVGGQQAGLLTGPVYTIHKCLSIIQLAQEQEQALGVPVIPVFWIAGEDHDYDEVNHVFTYQNETIKKHSYRIPGAGLTSVSALDMDHDQLNNWLERVFQAYGETAYTKDLLEQVKLAANNSRTLVDFFARLIHQLFGKHGLVLLDSGDDRLRQLEARHFTAIIDHNREIAAGVVNQLEKLAANGYHVQLDQSLDSMNLFINNKDERVLLYQMDGETYGNEAKAVMITKDELYATVEHKPERLSNNVVTRPLMQEMVLPTLAFIGGPGEIAYWSALSPAFHELGLEMPPVLLRHRLIMADRKTTRWLEQKGLDVAVALSEDFYRKKAAWLEAQHEWDVEATFNTVKANILKAYAPVSELAGAVDPHLEGLSQKNRDLITKQLDYMKRAIERNIEQKHAVELSKFERVKASLLPNGSPQERVWSAYYFMNYWGFDVVDRLLEAPFQFDGRPYIVYL